MSWFEISNVSLSLYLHIRIREVVLSPADKCSLVSSPSPPPTIFFFLSYSFNTWHRTSHRQEKDIVHLHHLVNDENTTITENDLREAAAPVEIVPIVTDLHIVRLLTAALDTMTIVIPHVVIALVIPPHVVTVNVPAV